MNHHILQLFNRAIPSNDKLPFDYVFKGTVKAGYLIHPSLCQQDVFAWASKQKFNPNTTFYKSFAQVMDKTRLELLVDQIIHYESTYGTEFEGKSYVPNNDPYHVDLTKFTLILPISKEEVIERCEAMLFSGIALKQDTIESIITILNGLDRIVNFNKVKNREAKLILMDLLSEFPGNSDEFIKFLVYKATKKTMLIKNDETIKLIKSSGVNISNYLLKYGLTKVASVFLKYKNILVAFKHAHHDNRRVINKLRKLAVKYHDAPIKTTSATIISDYISGKGVSLSLINSLNNFKKVSILQAISVYAKHTNMRAFVIRNQKLWMTNSKPRSGKNLINLYGLIYGSLVNSLRDKACLIYLPEGVNLTLPTSEKSFIGNYPLGTSFDLSNSEAIIGINWRSEDGANDLDLSLIDTFGNKIGWNADYFNENKTIVYSGDMTSADPEATELIYASHGFVPGIVKVNLYGGEIGAKFRIFIAKEYVFNLRKDYAVNPNNITFSIETTMDSKEKSFGVVSENKFILAQFRTGKGRVSGNSITNEYTKYALETLSSHIPLKELLLSAGFGFTSNPDDADINLKNLSKDTLISFLS
jgi:hypothetical protein